VQNVEVTRLLKEILSADATVRLRVIVAVDKTKLLKATHCSQCNPQMTSSTISTDIVINDKRQ